MGMYIYISEEDRKTKRVVEDAQMTEVFQEALRYDPSLMIEQRTKTVKKGWFKKGQITYFNLFHETPGADGSAYQARYQITGSGDREITTAYLHGVINCGTRLVNDIIKQLS